MILYKGIISTDLTFVRVYFTYVKITVYHLYNEFPLKRGVYVIGCVLLHKRSL